MSTLVLDLDDLRLEGDVSDEPDDADEEDDDDGYYPMLIAIPA